MHVLACLLLAGCAIAEMPVEMPANVAPPLHAFDIAPTDPRWTMTGSARLEHGALAVDYCCKAAGTFERALTEIATPGRWQLAFDHTNSECTAAMHVLVYTGDKQPTLHGRLDAEGSGTKRMEVSIADPSTPARLVVIGEGGLHCCGTTTISAIRIERVGP